MFHQVAYGVITLSTIVRGFYVTEGQLRQALTERVPAEVDQRMRQIRMLSFSGIFMFLGGFLIWNLDNAFCHHLVHARNQIQLPWAVVLEGHGWWHILTGLGKEFWPSFPPEMHEVIYADSISLRPGGTFPLRPKSCADSNAVVLLAISPLANSVSPMQRTT